MGIIKPILQAYFNEWTAQDTVLASSGSAVPCGPWPSGNWYPQDTHSGICTPTTPTSGELRGALFGAPLDTLQAGGVAGAGRAEELCTAARCAAVGTRGRISMENAVSGAEIAVAPCLLALAASLPPIG